MNDGPPTQVRTTVARVGWIGCALTLAFAAVLAAQEPGSLTGRVVDLSSGAPVNGALVAVEATNGIPVDEGALPIRSLTGTDGRFLLSPVPEGRIRVRVEHPGFGVHRQDLLIEGMGTAGIEITLSSVAIRLEPLLVEAPASGEFSGAGSPSSRNVINRGAIERARAQGQDLSELLRRASGITVRRPSGAGGQPCVEFRGARRADGACRPPALLLDGLPLADPTAVFGTFDLSELDQIQIVPPSEAGARYGTISGWGVILLTTRWAAAEARPLVPLIRRSSLAARPFEWSEVAEGRTYPWVQVYSTAFVGNAVGVAAAGTLLSQCIDLSTRRFYRGEQYCGWGPLLGAGLAALILPPLGGSLGARFGGSTERSHGSFGRSLALSLPAVVPGLALASMNAGSRGLSAIEVTGLVILLLGTPALNTLADHSFREDQR